jgi:hypothetical protein
VAQIGEHEPVRARRPERLVSSATASRGYRWSKANVKTGTDVQGFNETWKSAYETIPLAANMPKPWVSFDAETPCSDILPVASGKMRIIGSFTKFGDISQANFELQALQRNLFLALVEAPGDRSQ